MLFPTCLLVPGLAMITEINLNQDPIPLSGLDDGALDPDLSAHDEICQRCAPCPGAQVSVNARPDVIVICACVRLFWLVLQLPNSKRATRYAK
jgi:hypothetical protein